MSDIDKAFLLAHVLALVWYVAGLTAVQISLIRAMQAENMGIRSDSFEEAAYYQGMLLVPGGIAVTAQVTVADKTYDGGTVATITSPMPA